MKLFEIPVYALEKDILLKRYREKRNRLISDFGSVESFDGNDQRMNLAIDMCTYPQRLWEYNHIVGFITVCVEFPDISFEQYVPVKPVERYCWTSRKNKIFLMNNQLNGYHFNYTHCKRGEDIRLGIHQMFDDIIRNMVDKRFFVDREAFDQVDRLIDYSRLLGE